ncbi:hypothetical protein [Fodinibius salsisoli]|uniref:Uncharacterized protein n=1 Tax=Fodinibius salsisoli TaxID=2820877 RepID=A0ABT3PT26_9BACT|nr:hypothetical protein [Fodinibius salsisoli]MCW9709015.1 hypothetical protein [Fodinibius salsisoli]
MELYAEAFQQLAFISAVVGGLAFTAAASLLNAGTATNDPTALSRSAKITIGTAIMSALFMIISTFIWSFQSADLFRAAVNNQSFPKSVGWVNFAASISMITGGMLLFVSIGTSGWIGSRNLGIVTSIAAVVGIVALILMVLWFGDI